MKLRFFTLALGFLSALPALAVNDDDGRGDHPDAPPSAPEKERASFHLPPGFEIQLVAAEPEIDKPINLTFDGAGRLWVTGSQMYPWPAGTDAAGQPIPNFAKAFADIGSAFNAGNKAPAPSVVAKDTVRVLSDFEPGGHARKIALFAEGLNIPSGVQPLPRKAGEKGDTVIAYSIPGIWRLRDTEGDGVAHQREPLFESFGFLDTHGGSSSYLYWIDGWIYGTHGFRNHSEVHDKSGGTTVLDSGHTYRFRPDGSHFEIYTHGQTNPFGLSVDPLGNFYSADSHSRPLYLLLRGGWYEGIGKQHDGLGFAPRITNDGHGSTAIAGVTWYAADQFPEEYRGNCFNGNVVTQKLNRDRLEWHGSTPVAQRQPDFLTCDDPWFRPVNVKLGPDGALYIADFYNPIIGHYEFPLTDPRRDHTHGRIWRVVWRGEHGDAPIPVLPDLSKMDASALVAKLSDPNLVVRTLATQELVDRVGAVARPALEKAVEAAPPLGSEADPSKLDPKALGVGHALWALERLSEDGALRRLPPIQGDRFPAQEATILRERAASPENAAALLEAEKHIKNPADRRALADLLGKHADSAAIQPLLNIWNSAAADDAELIYTVRLALRDSLVQDRFAEPLRRIAVAGADQATLDRFADVSLGAKTPEAGAFLLEYLKKTAFAGDRAGAFLRQAALLVPAEKIGDLATGLQAAAGAPLAQRLALAENLEQAARQRGIKLPETAAALINGALIEALSSGDEGLLKHALESVREVQLPAKFEPLARLAADPARPEGLRKAALEAVANLPEGRRVLAAAVRDPSSMALRKRAAELLGSSNDEMARAALIEALATAPGELAIVIGGGLARTAAGAEALVSTIEHGKASASLLRATLVAAASEKWNPALRDRAAKLTLDLPPEDSRLDGVIAARAQAFRKAHPDAAHGAEVFRQNCAICHQLKNQGANVGPALDGIGARGVHRVIEDILDPNRNVDPMFRQTVVETTDGQTIAGLNPRVEGALLVLTDATGKTASVPQASVKTQTQSKLSLMPVGFESAIPAADFNDLLAFLIGS